MQWAFDLLIANTALRLIGACHTLECPHSVNAQP
jgi:hypothetical protein